MIYLIFIVIQFIIIFTFIHFIIFNVGAHFLFLIEQREKAKEKKHINNSPNNFIILKSKKILQRKNYRLWSNKKEIYESS